MYVAVKGGEKAIRAAHALQEQKRRGDGRLPELSVEQIGDQLSLAVDRVMTEGGIADRELAALALKQASGDNVEAIFLLRAYRTTLPRLAVSEPINTAEMRLERRISAVYKDIPGGQLLGPTYDYTHRLLDFTLLANGEAPSVQQANGEAEPTPHVFSLLTQQGLVVAGPDAIQFMNKIYGVLHRPCGCIGSIVFCLIFVHLPGKQYPRKIFLYCHLNKRISLVIHQHGIVFRTMFLNKITLQHQRFQLRIRDNILKPGNMSHHLFNFHSLIPAGLEILPYPVFQ